MSFSDSSSRTEALRAAYKNHQKRLIKQSIFGVVGLILGPFGESCLTRSSPIFDKIGLSYNLWQISYTLGLGLFALIWLVSTVRLWSDLNHYKEQHGRALKQDEHQRLKIEAREQRREEEALEEENAAILIRRRSPPPAPLGKPLKKGSKFDY